MLRKPSRLILLLTIVAMVLSACDVPGSSLKTTGTPLTPTATATPAPTPAPTAAPTPTKTVKPADHIINVYSFNEEFPGILRKYASLHPEFPYQFNTMSFATADVVYEDALDQGLATGDVDIYAVEHASVPRYTQGEKAGCAMPYADLGIDVARETAAAQIAPYVMEAGTRPSDGKIVALAYQGTGGAMIYRRSLAKATWGTDKPTVIADKVGPGWDKFFAAARDLKKKGYAIVSGEGDIWHSIENSADHGWLTADGKLYIDPKREAFLDMAKELAVNSYSNDTQDWTDAWYDDMAGKGKKPVFSFFGPAWLINYVMEGHCGGTKRGRGTYGDWAICLPPEGFFWSGTWVFANANTLSGDPDKTAAVKQLIEWVMLDCSRDGLQYQWANGTASGNTNKDTVASGTVMAMANGKLPFLRGQDMYDVLITAGKMANGRNLTMADQNINGYWRICVSEYASGKLTRAEAIALFKQNVKEECHIDAAP